MADTIALYKSLSPAQLEVVIQSGWRRFAADGPQQRFFYPKLCQLYAENIARQWDAVQFTAGYVVEFSMPIEFMARFTLQSIGYAEHNEYRVPVAELELFNSQIVGRIILLSAFSQPQEPLRERPLMTEWTRSEIPVALTA